MCLALRQSPPRFSSVFFVLLLVILGVRGEKCAPQRQHQKERRKERERDRHNIKNREEDRFQQKHQTSPYFLTLIKKFSRDNTLLLIYFNHSMSQTMSSQEVSEKRCTRSTKGCAKCGTRKSNDSELKSCSRCLLVKYCSRECQK